MKQSAFQKTDDTVPEEVAMIPTSKSSAPDEQENKGNLEEKLLSLIAQLQSQYQAKPVLSLNTHKDKDGEDYKKLSYDYPELTGTLKEVYEFLETILLDIDHSAHQFAVDNVVTTQILRPETIHKLIWHENKEIGLPFIKKSPSLSLRMMQHIVDKGHNQQRFALCERASLPLPIIDGLINVNEPMLVIALLCNASLRFSRQNVLDMYDKFSSNGYFVQAVNARIKSAIEPYFTIYVIEAMQVDLPKFANDIDEKFIRAFINRKLMPESLLNAAILGDAASLVQLFALYGLNSTKNVTELLYNDDNGLQLLYSNAGMYRKFFPLFKAAWIFGWSSPGPKDKTDQKRYLYSRTIELLEEYPHIVEGYNLAGTADFLRIFNENCKSRALTYIGL